MMKYLKAEAEIIKFDNSDVVTASVCGGTQQAVDQCMGDGKTHATESEHCYFGLFGIVRLAINIACATVFSPWWFETSGASVDNEFAAENSFGDRDF